MKKVAIISKDKKVKELVDYCIPRGFIVIHLKSISEIDRHAHLHTFSLVIIDTDHHYEELLIYWQIFSDCSFPLIALSSSEYHYRLFNIPGAIIRDVAQKPISKNAFRQIIIRQMVDVSQIDLSSRSCNDINRILIGDSKAIRKIRCKIQTFADADDPVLIYGESGTGKEVVAQCIAKCSKGHKARLFPQNIAAVPDGLIETTLFGSVSGAFTGAKNTHGLFSSCNNGTIFLDEIGEINHSSQVKLLRIIETGEYCKVGTSEIQKAHARIICATNKDLKKEVEKGEFRLDLYHRINVLKIYIPPLRERSEDILPLTSYFLQQHDKIISYNALVHLSAQKWPGNVRELFNVLKSAAQTCKNNKIEINDITCE